MNLKTISRSFQKIENVFVDILFPKKCIRCQRSGPFVCDTCKKFLEYQTIQICPVCEKTMTMRGEQCRQCRQTRNNDLTALVSAGNYQDKFLTELVHLYKYKFVEDLAESLGSFMTEALKKWPFPVSDAIIPIPLHKKRLKWRGYNQSSLLAEYISKNITPGIEIPVLNDLLLRTRNTTPQMKIKGYEQRKSNIKNAFSLNPQMENISFSGKNILLVDDICTTGATIFECAKTLAKLKPRTISAIVLARQNM